MLERIDTVCMKVNNVQRASDWYEEHLGFEVVFRGEGYRILHVGDKGVPLTIEEGEGANKEGNYPIFYSNDIKETYETLKGKGVQLGKLHDDGVNTFFDFFDVDSNRLQVCHYRE